MEVYLDNAATMPLSESVEQHIWEICQAYGNSGSIHTAGKVAKKYIDEARYEVAKQLCLVDKNGKYDESQIIFTSGGSESNATAVRACSLEAGNRVFGGAHIIIGGAEHPSMKVAMDHLRSLHYIDVVVPRADGIIYAEDVEALMTEQTALVSVMYQNNETGMVNDVYNIGKLCKERGCMFICDAVQAFGLNKIDAKKLNADFITMSGHKIGSLKGVGILYAKNKKMIYPLIFGGENQEHGRRGGTQNTPGIMSLMYAMRDIDIEADTAKIDYIRKLFAETVLSKVPNAVVNFAPETYGCGKILSMRFDGVDAQTLVLALSSVGVYVSAGSACHSAETSASMALTNSGLTDAQARSTVRFSFSKNNTEEEVLYAAEQVKTMVNLLRG